MGVRISSTIAVLLSVAAAPSCSNSGLVLGTGAGGAPTPPGDGGALSAGAGGFIIGAGGTFGTGAFNAAGAFDTGPFDTGGTFNTGGWPPSSTSGAPGVAFPDAGYAGSPLIGPPETGGATGQCVESLCSSNGSGAPCCLSDQRCGVDRGEGCILPAPPPEIDCGDAGIGTVGPSCEGLPATCGPCRTTSCCASSVVPGGAFYRSYDGVTYKDRGFPATVSDFTLDDYEITVGRFRKFVAAYSQDMIPAGAGKNPNNPADKGWDIAWNSKMAPDAAYLSSADYLKCGNSAMTWTDTPGSNENRPINCINWYEAYAFCAWDGGRLPTEAEWNYAASGGSEQRQYPWGNTPPGNDATVVIYNDWYNGNGHEFSPDQSPSFGVEVSNIAPVGSDAAGNGRWGQADLAGNIMEMMLDSYSMAYVQTSCTNCANLADAGYGIVWHGGDFTDGASAMLSANRQSGGGRDGRVWAIGARCARSAR